MNVLSLVAKELSIMADITITFDFERETKNTFRFAETGDNQQVGTLYVQKSAFGGGAAPSSVTVTITPKA